MKAFDSCAGRADFELLRHSRRINGETLWLRMAKDATLERPRVAFAVNSHYGKATQRNRLRRRLRAVLTDLRPGLALGRYLIGARGAIATTGVVSYRRVCRDLETMLAKAERVKTERVKAGQGE